MIEVDLQEFCGAHFIVACDGPVKYSHQCGGLACQQREMAGFLVPCPRSREITSRLRAYFYDEPKYKGHCHNGIDESDATFIDDLLASIGQELLCVDRAMLSDSVEAWIYLKTASDLPCFPFCYNSEPDSHIVLIWKNSD